MQKLIEFLEKFLMPIAGVMSGNRYLIAIRDGFLISLPFTIFGSIFTAIANLPFMATFLGDDRTSALQLFVSPTFSMTMGIISLITAAGIGYSLSKYYQVNEVYGSIVAFVAFLMITPTTIVLESGEVISDAISLSSLGSVAMFSSIIISIVSIEVYRLAIQKKWTIKMPDSVPQLVSDSFSSFIPVVCVLIVAFIIRVVFEATSFESLNNFIYLELQKPLSTLGTSYLATVIVAMLINLFWFFGLHGHTIVGSVMFPIWTEKSIENFTAFQNGDVLPNIVTGNFLDFFSINGAFISIPILISLLVFFKKRKDWQTLGKVALAPGIFGVYEPLIFGLPVMLNPILFLPLILTPVITTTISYISMSVGLVPLTTGITLPYTTPLVLSGYIVTNSIMGSILQIVLIIILSIMWYVFLKIMDGQTSKK